MLAKRPPRLQTHRALGFYQVLLTLNRLKMGGARYLTPKLARWVCCVRCVEPVDPRASPTSGGKSKVRCMWPSNRAMHREGLCDVREVHRDQRLRHAASCGRREGDRTDLRGPCGEEPKGRSKPRPVCRNAGSVAAAQSQPSPPANFKHIVSGNIDIRFTARL